MTTARIHSRFGAALVAWTGVAATAWLGCGCDRLAELGSRGKVEVPALETPMAVARALNVWHQERRYGLFEQYVAADQRRMIENTLMAFNRLLLANQRAQRRLMDMHNERVAGEFDLGDMADRMGLFSRDVRFHSERIDGDRAVVIAQVADRVPLEQFSFVRRDGRWVYTPDPPIPNLPELITGLAVGLEDFAYQLEQRKLSVEQIRSEFRYRVWVRMRQIRQAVPGPTTTSAPAASKPARSAPASRPAGPETRPARTRPIR